MTTRNQFDEIHDSILNGQWTQAYNQMRALSPNDRADMLNYFFYDLARPELALQAARNYMRKAKE